MHWQPTPHSPRCCEWTCPQPVGHAGRVALGVLHAAGKAAMRDRIFKLSAFAGLPHGVLLPPS
jgi:hypothetical protein